MCYTWITGLRHLVWMLNNIDTEGQQSRADRLKWMKCSQSLGTSGNFLNRKLTAASTGLAITVSTVHISKELIWIRDIWNSYIFVTATTTNIAGVQVTSQTGTSTPHENSHANLTNPTQVHYLGDFPKLPPFKCVISLVFIKTGTLFEQLTFSIDMTE